MKPARAEALPLSGDEADLIRDPVFRLNYIAARKRANS